MFEHAAHYAMVEEISLVDPTSDEWMRFIDQHPGVSMFHHPAWIRVIRETYGYPTFAVCLKRDGILRSGIPFAEVRSAITGNRMVSFPFSDHCVPLLHDDDPSVLRRLIVAVPQTLDSDDRRIEIHAEIGELQHSFLEQKFFLHTLDLRNDPDALFASFDRRTTQRSIRIAEKKRVAVRECRAKEEFDLFYTLHVKTRKRLGVPVQPKALFDNIWTHIIQRGLGFALIAFHGEVPIGGGVFFHFKNTLVFKYSASDMKFKSLQPSHAFIWSAIQRARQRGCTTLDFGRTDRSHEHLRRFKKTWGAVERELNYAIIAKRARPEGPSKLQAALAHVIRHSPEFVCRLSGEVLYKHFA